VLPLLALQQARLQLRCCCCSAPRRWQRRAQSVLPLLKLSGQSTTAVGPLAGRSCRGLLAGFILKALLKPSMKCVAVFALFALAAVGCAQEEQDESVRRRAGRGCARSLRIPSRLLSCGPPTRTPPAWKAS
jgi:hypothetical protein